jgi:hypothetical protein
MASPTAQKHLVAPPGHNAEDQKPGRDVDLTNDDSENVPTRMGVGATMVAMAAGKAKKKRVHGMVGGPCGHLSNASNIPFLSSKMRHVTLMYATDTLPEDLQDVNAPGWQDGAKLLELFKLPTGTVRGGLTARKPKRVPRRFPSCLLLDAKTVADKMRVVSWWLSLEAKQMATTFDALRQIYRAPSKSNDRYIPPPRQGSGEENAVSTELQTSASLASSYVHPNGYLNSTAKRRRKMSNSDPTVATATSTTTAQLLLDKNVAAASTTTAQLLADENVAAAREALLLSYQAFLQATANAAGGAGAASLGIQHDALLMIRTDAAAAAKNDNDTMRPRPTPERMRYTVLARNEASAKEMLGNVFLDEMRARNRPSQETVAYYADDHYGDIPLTF